MTIIDNFYKHNVKYLFTTVIKHTKHMHVFEIRDWAKYLVRDAKYPYLQKKKKICATYLYLY